MIVDHIQENIGPIRLEGDLETSWMWRPPHGTPECHLYQQMVMGMNAIELDQYQTSFRAKEKIRLDKLK